MLTIVYKKNKKCQRPHEQISICETIIASFVSVLLTLTTCAQASPTMDNRNTYLLNYSNLSQTQNQNTAESLQSANTCLVGIGREITKPHVTSVTSINAQQDYIESLPAVPAAITMALLGFLCISLVRDRKVWLTALSGLLWAGQAGIYIVPQLARHLRSRMPACQHLYSKAVHCHSSEGIDRERCDIEGTRYIALLNYLAGIPTTTKLLTIITKCYFCFKPAFIFTTLSRGPPNSTQILSYGFNV